MLRESQSWYLGRFERMSEWEGKAVNVERVRLNRALYKQEAYEGESFVNFYSY